jgi:hypothetical protein
LSAEQVKFIAYEMGITNESVGNLVLTDKDEIIDLCTVILCDEYKKADECDISAKRFYMAESVLERI